MFHNVDAKIINTFLPKQIESWYIFKEFKLELEKQKTSVIFWLSMKSVGQFQ